jgi:hypothetical protein
VDLGFGIWEIRKSYLFFCLFGVCVWYSMKVVLVVVFCFFTFMQYASCAGTPAMQVIAGDGTFGFSGDGGPATSARLVFPVGVWADSVGNAYFTTIVDNRVRYVDTATGIITTIMGDGNIGWNSDGGAGTTFPLFSPWGIQGDDSEENIYVADGFHIWKYNTVTQQATRFAGGEAVCTLDFCPDVTPGNGGPATSAYFKK